MLLTKRRSGYSRGFNSLPLVLLDIMWVLTIKLAISDQTSSFQFLFIMYQPNPIIGSIGRNVTLTKSCRGLLPKKAHATIILSPATRPNVPTSVANNPMLMKVSFRALGVVLDMRLVLTP